MEKNTSVVHNCYNKQISKFVNKMKQRYKQPVNFMHKFEQISCFKYLIPKYRLSEHLDLLESKINN